MRNRTRLEPVIDKGKYVRIAGLVITIGLGLSLLGNILSIQQAQNKIADAQSKVTELEEEHDELARQLEIVESDEYIEAQLRDKLGMAKEGEIILVLPSEAVLRKLAPTYTREVPTLPDPNWKKWLELFM